ncbi:MAG: sodium:solute symporter [Bryobacteraceae bacterium]
MLDAAIIAAYFLTVFAIGLYHSRKKDTTREYFLAGGHVGWFAVGASLFSTNISSEHFIGLAGAGATTGLATSCYELSAAFCLFLLAWLFLPHYMRSKVFTMPEFLEKRFDGRSRWYLTMVSLFAYVFTKISVHLYAGAILMREVAGWDFLTTSILLVIATGIYTISGGLAAVIYTDLFQTFVLITGAVVLSVIGLDKAGGFAGLRAALPSDFFHMIKPASDPAFPWPGTTMGVIILGIWYWCTDQSIVQKTLSAKNLSAGRKGSFFCAALKVLPVFCLVLPGLIAKTLYGAEITGDNAFPTLVVKLMPPGLKGLMVAALMAALMSAMSSVLNSCSTLITMDVYKRTHPHKNEKQLVHFGRLTTGVIVGVSILWIPVIPYMSGELYQYLQSIQAEVAAPITAVFLVGILWPGATARSAIVTLVTGGIIGAVRFLLDVAHNALKWDIGPLTRLVDFSFLNFAVIVFAFCVVLMIAVSKIDRRPTRAKIAELTLDWSHQHFQHVRGTAGDVIFTLTVTATVLGIWIYFA